MGLQDIVRACLGKYARFSGEARRAEFSWVGRFVLLGNLLFGALGGLRFGAAPDGQPVSLLGAPVSLAMLLPNIAVGMRRLHDRDMSGWWYLLILVPILGTLLLLWLFVQKGTDGPNRFGPDPLA